MATSKQRAARQRGHQYERDVVNKLLERGWDAATSRYVSRRLDDEGVDIASNDYPFQIQCKATTIQPSMHTLLTETAATAIFYRRIIKQGERFFKDGEYVVISQEDFLNLVDKANKKKL